HLICHIKYYRHRKIVEEPEMEELQPKRRSTFAPQRVVVPEADVAPLIVGELQEPVRHLPARIVKGFLRQLPGAPGDVVQLEGARRPRRERGDCEYQEHGPAPVARRSGPRRRHHRLQRYPAGTIRLLSSTTQGCGLVSRRRDEGQVRLRAATGRVRPSSVSGPGGPGLRGPCQAVHVLKGS